MSRARCKSASPGCGISRSTRIARMVGTLCYELLSTTVRGLRD